jgi:hypothetical protein
LPSQVRRDTQSRPGPGIRACVLCLRRPRLGCGPAGLQVASPQPGSFQRHTTLSKRRSYRFERRSCDAEQESPLRARLGGPCRIGQSGLDTDTLHGVKSALELNTKRRAQSLTLPAVFDLRWGLYGDEPLHAHERPPRGASVSTAAFDAVLPLCALGCSRATGFVGAAIPARARLADSTAPSGVLYVLVQCRCKARLGGLTGTRPCKHSGIVLRNKPQNGPNNATLPRDNALSA